MLFRLTFSEDFGVSVCQKSATSSQQIPLKWVCSSSVSVLRLRMHIPPLQGSTGTTTEAATRFPLQKCAKLPMPPVVKIRRVAIIAFKILLRKIIAQR